MRPSSMEIAGDQRPLDLSPKSAVSPWRPLPNLIPISKYEPSHVSRPPFNNPATRDCNRYSPKERPAICNDLSRHRSMPYLDGSSKTGQSSFSIGLNGLYNNIKSVGIQTNKYADRSSFSNSSCLTTTKKMDSRSFADDMSSSHSHSKTNTKQAGYGVREETKQILRTFLLKRKARNEN